MRATHRPFTTLALALSLFVAALELTVVSTAMPTVVSDLGGIQSYAWVFTAYMLSSTITVPIYGKLADLYGRKPIILFGSALFLGSSIACGLSTSMNMLIAFRVLQGLGAGAMQPIALTIIGDIYTLEQRAKVQGAFSAVWGIAGLAGPLTGGLIVKYLTWHWVFFINIPIGIASMVLLVVFFHEQMERKARVQLDFAGAALLCAGVVALLFGVQGTGRTLLALPLAAVLLTAFVFAELRAAEPIIPMSLFKIPTIAISSLAGALFTAAQFGATTYVPLYVQGVLGGSATMAGAMLTPMIVAWPLASVIGGRLMLRIGFRPLIIGGLGLATLGTVLMALMLKPGASLLVPRIAMGVFGVGLGFSAMATMVAVQTSVGWELRGVVTAGSMFFRTIGGSLGVGAMGGVMVAQLMNDPSIPVSAATELLGPEHGRSLSPAVLETLGSALNHGLSINFWIMCAAMVAAFAVGLFFPKMKQASTPPNSVDIPAAH
ncbi:MDR family MFS transporter [Corallococcus sicarius]|uniref:MFS transporter n=1 Tax=Corallococcus sicarius TaxID=2316726 RepID=A0A3A8NCS5_9BACT|nr:MDR family MFS transporter [Corallococcus sicarius]RKH37752.1 MFS transporter [Corallococcus sicarius]